MIRIARHAWKFPNDDSEFLSNPIGDTLQHIGSAAWKSHNTRSQTGRGRRRHDRSAHHKLTSVDTTANDHCWEQRFKARFEENIWLLQDIHFYV